MAFYSLWNWFSPWSKRNYPNMIYWYKEYVLKTPEQRRKEKALRQKRARELFIMYNLITSPWD